VAVKCYFSYLLQSAKDSHTVGASHDPEHPTLVPTFDEVQRGLTFYLHYNTHRRTQETTSILLQADRGGLGGDH
jgi:hypothetical protein